VGIGLFVATGGSLDVGNVHSGEAIPVTESGTGVSTETSLPAGLPGDVVRRQPLPHTALGEQPREETPVATASPQEKLAWIPSLATPPAAGGAESGNRVCGDVSVVFPDANGWFVYPTGNPYVSGWWFHDPRNPAHIGLDYACAIGDPIYAADSGVVVAEGWDSGYGRMIELDHGNGFHTRYGHFDEVTVACANVVRQGKLIGYCGSTGWSSGPHLHFEIRYYGIPQDPTLYLPGSRARERMAAVPSPGSGWFAEFYNNENLSGAPAVTRYDHAIGFEWRLDSPAPGVWADAFSARWTMRTYLETANYRFCAMSDDGARIWVGGDLILDEWHANNGVAYCGEYAALAGTREVKVEYYEHEGDALIYVWWEKETTGE
jgi:hypothetical protein